MHFGFDIPEFWGFGIRTALLLLGLGYGGWRAGWLSRRERERIDAATVAAQAQEQAQEKSRQAASGAVGRRAVHILCLIQTRAGSDIALVELALSRRSSLA
jgi:hypothetical protein